MRIQETIDSNIFPFERNYEMWFGDFKSSLSAEDQDWLAEHEEVEADIFDYLKGNAFSDEAEAFGRAAVKAKREGGEVDFEELYIPIDIVDTPYTEQGPLVNIPDRLVLGNGDTVLVEFGQSEDLVSADQPIAEHTLNGLKHALTYANNNLDYPDRITKIYIKTTTNGVHSVASNHYNGTAIDISRINGIKIYVSGVTEPIGLLQEGIDSFQWIRENFGPFFKHKYFLENNTWDYNYNIGGHKDHIHFSTRK